MVTLTNTSREYVRHNEKHTTSQRPVIGNVARKDNNFTPTMENVPLTIDEMIRYRSALSGDSAIMAYPSSGTSYTDYSTTQLDCFAYFAAKHYETTISQRTSSAEIPDVIAILGPSDLEYIVTILALTKLGHTVLFLSPRISKEAHLSLLKVTKARNLIIHGNFEGMASLLKGELPNLRVHRIVEQSVYHKPLGEKIDTKMDQHLDLKQENKYIAWIIHSSGSTSLPKPVYLPHRAVINNYRVNNLNMKGFITMPLYHSHGVATLMKAFYCGKQVHIYNAKLPLTAQHLIKTLKDHRFEVFHGVPYSLKLLAETEEGIDLLAACKCVMFGGSACPDSLGDKLTDRGVLLLSHYGTTETGQLMSSERPKSDKLWNYVRPSPDSRPFIRFEEQGQGLLEVICLPGWPGKVMTNREDGSYATRDLFTKHPSMEAYKYYSRLDDTINLVNGEKANPLLLEGMIRQHPDVKENVVFGAGKSRLGLLLIPSRAIDHDVLLDHLWPTIELAQQDMPAYAQLSKDMVKILPLNTTYPSTDKGTVVRQAFYRTFEKIIDESYEEEEKDGDLLISGEELRNFLRQKVQAVVGESESILTDETDFFGLGIDSLQATQLRTAIVKAINLKGKKLGLNVVFDYPNIRSLARKLESLQTGMAESSISTESEIERLITKYRNFDKHVSCNNGLDGQFVVMTGASGSLGAHVVAQLVSLDRVKKVYCLVRSTSTEQARERVLRSMSERNVLDHIARPNLEKISALPSDLSHPYLGLTTETYTKLTNEITCLIHCAWSVNFNLRLSSFEQDCIAGTKHLINLCLSAKRPHPASFNFCSSVSTAAATTEDIVPEALPEKFSYAQNMGYAQSKLVAEHLCHHAAQQTGISARVLRIGQIIGDTNHGIWNDTEAIPLIFRSVTAVGALPRINESPRWLPLDVVGKAVTEISISPPTQVPSGVLNVTNHQTFHWTKDLLPYLHNSELEFVDVSPQEWIRRLRNSNPDPSVNPSYKLVEFFTKRYGGDHDLGANRGGGVGDGSEGANEVVKDWKTDKARLYSKSLAAAPLLDQELVHKIIRYFKENCW